MKINFKYTKEKDIWCLLNKGKSSNNSSEPTEVYKLLVSKCGQDPTEQATASFIDEYLKENDVSIDTYIEKYGADWAVVSGEYQKRAKAIFNITLPQKITVYLTVNNRNPYSIAESLFFVTVPRETVRKTVMHELWHFYTWYGLGAEQEEILGKQRYNDLKEALTVLLNEEFADLMPKGVRDEGYPQHRELREEIRDLWSKEKNIRNIWRQLTNKNN